MSSLSKPSLTRIAQAPCLSNNSMTSKHLKTTLFLNFSEELECPQCPKLPLLRCQNFLRFFLPFRSVGFCLRALGPRAAAPEAEHRCTTQPSTATFPPSRGSSRPGQRWMCRTNTAVASGRRIWGRKTILEAMGTLHEEVDEMLICVFTFCGKCQSKHVHHHFVLFFVVTIFHDCVLCPP